MTNKYHFTTLIGMNYFNNELLSPLRIFIEMKTTRSFDSTMKFYADNHFAHGIDRCGEFTKEQTDLLIEHGYAYQEIANRKRKPQNAEESQFLAFCEGERQASTKHEKAWSAFCNKTSGAKRPGSASMFSSKFKPLDLAPKFALEPTR